MPNNNPRPPKRSWRGDRSTSPRPAAGQPAWKTGDKAAKPGARGSRGKKIWTILGVGALIVIVSVAIVIVIFWPRPVDPFRLVLVGANYDQNLAVPSNAHGRRGLDGLADWAKEYNSKSFGQEKGKNVDAQRQSLQGEDNDPVLAGITDPTSHNLTNAPTVVVFLTGDGGGDGQGAYILPENAGPRDPKAVYHISKALDALEKLPKTTRKLLILDASSNGPDWAMGELHNDFMRSVKNLDARIKDIPNLVVLCACDEGQRSWTSDEFGQTAFAHFVIEGLKGGADKALGEDRPDYKPDETRISAMKLTRYVQFQVERWALRNRNAEQKPLLLGNEQTAKEMELCGADPDYKAPDPTTFQAKLPPDLEGLRALWTEHKDLADASPSPADYTPAQWREYEAALLRYEQLLRSDPTGNAALRGRIDELHKQIVGARKLDRASMSVSLAAPTAFGYTVEPDPTAPDPIPKDKFDKIWSDKATDQLKALTINAADPMAERLTRLRLAGMLLDRAEIGPDDKNFQSACDMLPAVVESPGPAEANFAVMVRESEKQLPVRTEKELPGGSEKQLPVVPWDRLKTALKLRRSAETAALGLGTKGADLPAYSEQTMPWIAEMVNTADDKRRLGEDLLFDRYGPAQKDKADKTPLPVDAVLQAAESDKDFGYTAVRARALAVRQAIQVRDKALAELPWYTQWLGRRILSGEEEQQLATLWANVHKLCRQLDPEDRAKAPPPDQQTVNAISAGLQQYHDDLSRACGEKDKQWAELQDNLADLEDLLSVPLIDPDVRINLLQNAAKISLALNKETKDTAPLSPEATAQALDRVKKLAYQQLRLAAAVLGTDDKDGQQALNLLPPEDKKPGEWEPNLVLAGEEIGRGFGALAHNAADATVKAHKATMPEAGKPLRQAAVATRFLDAGEADAWLISAAPPVDPAAENRAVQLHDLLLWQAERAYRDYWASLDPTAPYYRAAGIACCVDAGTEVASATDLKDVEKTARLTEVTAMEGRLNAPDDVAFRWGDGKQWKATVNTLHLTDINDLQFQYGLVGTQYTPPGRPVVWPVPGEKLTVGKDELLPRALERVAAKPEDITAASAASYGVDVSRLAEGPLPDDIQKIPPAQETTGFTVNYLFRGRSKALPTTVVLHNRPDVVAYQPKEEDAAAIAVQADPADLRDFAALNGELVVVIDYSGSMKDKHVPPTSMEEKDTRINKALDALEECLANLPDGVNVTVMTFSAEDKAHPKTRKNPTYVEREKKPWSKADRDPLMKHLRYDLEPAYNTPLARATVKAADYFTPNFKGTKTILILTDGGDNDFYPSRDGSDSGKDIRIDPQTGKELTMLQYLERTFKGSGIHIHVVGFRLDDMLKKPEGDLKPWERDEKEGYLAYRSAIVDGLNGSFEDVEDAKDLAGTLQQYFLQVRFRIEYDNGDPLLDPNNRNKVMEPQQVSGSNRNLRPVPVPEAPRDYYVRIEVYKESGVGHDLPRQHVHVVPGEVLVLDLQKASDPNSKQPFELRRDVYAKSKLLMTSQPVMDPMQVDPKWWLAPLGNQSIKNHVTLHARDVTLSVEGTDDHVPVDGTVQRAQPTLAWFNLMPPDGAKAPDFDLRFYPLPGYPAPVWRLNLNPKIRNVAPPAPVLDSWWCEHQLPVEAVKTLTQGPGKDYSKASDLVGTPIEVTPVPGDAPASVVIETLKVEDHYVEETPGEWSRNKVSCLVVRLRYPPGRPYIVRPSERLTKTPSGQWTGYEHRIYTEANMYTGVFYGIGEDQLKNLDRLELISLEGVKAGEGLAKPVHPAPLRIPLEGPGTGDPPNPFPLK